MNAATQQPRWHKGAVLSFLLGVAAVGPFLALAGVPAIVLGFRGLRAVNASEGRSKGARLAVAGMILGGVGTLLTIAGVAIIAVLRLQVTTQRMTCSDNLRQIGVALNKYADAHDLFPAATPGPAELPPPLRLSFFADVVPLLQEGTRGNARFQKLASRIDRTSAWDDPANAAVVDTPVRLFLCPAHPDYDPNTGPGLTTYVGMAGIGPDAAGLPRQDPRAGVFGYSRGVARKEINRGLNYTMMALETARDNGPWLAGGPPTVRDLDPKEERYSGPGRPFGGLHKGIVNVLWVDGSVRPLSDETPAPLYRLHATIKADAK